MKLHDVWLVLWVVPVHWDLFPDEPVVLKVVFIVLIPVAEAFPICAEVLPQGDSWAAHIVPLLDYAEFREHVDHNPVLVDVAIKVVDAIGFFTVENVEPTKSV